MHHRLLQHAFASILFYSQPSYTFLSMLCALCPMLLDMRAAYSRIL